MPYLKTVTSPSGKNYYYWMRGYREEGKVKMEVLQPIPEEEIEWKEKGGKKIAVWTKSPERLKENILKKLIAIFIRQRVNTVELPTELDFNTTEATVLTNLIESEVVPEYAEYF